MCSNYRPPKPEVLQTLGRGLPSFSFDADCYPARSAPFLANCLPGEWMLGTFGLLPQWAEPTLPRHTYNARSETVHQKPSYRRAWARRQLAVIPVQAFYEPKYGNDGTKPVRWRMERADGQPFGLAGIWETKLREDGATWWSFSMLTINADEHPLMRQFHKPGDEKRSVVVLPDDEWDDWLSAKTEADVRSFLRGFDSDHFRATSDPRSTGPGIGISTCG